VPPLLADPRVGAVLHLGQPSVQLAGVGDLLFGRRSPAGRAVQTVFPVAYQHMVSPFDFNMRPGASRWPRPDSPGPCADPYVEPVTPSANCTLGTNPGRTYRFYNDTAVVPFGFGLSYARFEYAVVAVAAAAAVAEGATEAEEEGPGEEEEARGVPRVDVGRVRKAVGGGGGGGGGGGVEGPAEAEGDDVALLFGGRKPPPLAAAFPKAADDVPALGLVVNVTNTGTVDADDVVLGFVSPPGAGARGLPRKTLFDFDRVHVRAGETVTVRLYPALSAFAPVAEDGAHRALVGRHVLSFGMPETAALGMGYAERGVMVG